VQYVFLHFYTFYKIKFVASKKQVLSPQSSFTLCVLFANDLPKIVPYDDAVNNRARVISYTKPYVENPGEYELKLDPHLDAEIDTLSFQRCFLEILLQQYTKRGSLLGEPTEVVQAKEDWIGLGMKWDASRLFYRNLKSPI